MRAERTTNLLTPAGAAPAAAPGAAPVDDNSTATADNSELYLSRSVRYDGGKLLDAAGDAVMMEWVRPLMECHASMLACAGADGEMVPSLYVGRLEVARPCVVLDLVVPRGKILF